MESAGIIPIVLTAMGVVAAVLLGVWGIAARYDRASAAPPDAISSDTSAGAFHRRRRGAAADRG